MKSLSATGIRAYQRKRQAQGAANASINREVALIRRGFMLAMEDGKLHHRPATPMLKEAPPRSGVLKREQYEAVLAKLPRDLRGVLVFGYWTGWRKSEVLGLEWRHVDRKEQLVRLDPGTTKNGEGRTLPYGLVPDLVDAIDSQWEAHKALRADGTICPYVFPSRRKSERRNGQRVRSFNRAWKSAVKAAGVPGTIFHDLRRTAVRNLSRAGVPETVAMQITGHKTRSIFDRYNITNEADKRDALAAVAASNKDQTRASEGQRRFAQNGRGA